MTLKEVAANCGYSDIAYFCRVFKKINQGTPTQYRLLENGPRVPDHLQRSQK